MARRRKSGHSHHCHDGRRHARRPGEVYSGWNERFHCQAGPAKRTGENARQVADNNVNGLSELAGPEKKRLLDLASGMDRIILLLLFETGLDLESLINLRVSDLDTQSGQLQVAPDRKIQLFSAALSEIKEFLKSRPGQVYLLEGRCGKPVTSKWKRCVLENLQLRAGQEKQ